MLVFHKIKTTFFITSHLFFYIKQINTKDVILLPLLKSLHHLSDLHLWDTTNIKPHSTDLFVIKQNFITSGPLLSNMWTVLVLSFPLADRTNGHTPLGFIGFFHGNHSDAVYDWTDAEAQSAARAAISHHGKVGLWVECYSLERQ